jgi:signal peptidase
MLILATIIVALKLLGYSFLTVQTGSMVDVYPVGAIIIVKPTTFEEVQVGDVISYRISDDTIVTHRVISIDIDTQSFTTQGDENNSPDSLPVDISNVVGRPILSVNRLGYLYMFASTTHGKIVLGVLLVLAVVISCYPKPISREDGEDEDKNK